MVSIVKFILLINKDLLNFGQILTKTKVTGVLRSEALSPKTYQKSYPQDLCPFVDVDGPPVGRYAAIGGQIVLRRDPAS